MIMSSCNHLKLGYCCFVRFFSNSTMKLSAVNHYSALGISPKATQGEVKSAYYDLSKVYHPDKNHGSADAATKFRDITAAYEVLGNVRLRRLYDKGIDMGRGGTIYRHPGEDDDPTTRFYRSRERRSKPPMATGRTPIYDFDEWSRLHYGATFAKDMARKRRVKHTRQEQIEMDLNDYKIMVAVAVFALLVILGLTNDNSFDQVVPQSRKSKESETTLAKH